MLVFLFGQLYPFFLILSKDLNWVCDEGQMKLYKEEIGNIMAPVISNCNEILREFVDKALNKYM